MNKETDKYRYHFTEFFPREEAQERLKTLFLSDIDRQNLLKMLVGWEIADRVQVGEHIEIGSGTTSEAAIRAIGMRLKQEPQLYSHFVATSRKLAVLAQSLDIDVESFDETLKKLDSPASTPDLDWGFDGADEVEAIANTDGTIKSFRLIKGGKGALTIEKVIARRCKKWICIVDESKVVKKIGAFPVAVEVREEAAEKAAELFIQKYGAVKATKREGFITDKGNCILDVQMKPGAIRVGWEKEWNTIPGVIENGIFDEKQPTEVLVSHADGSIESLYVGGFHPNIKKPSQDALKT